MAAPAPSRESVGLLLRELAARLPPPPFRDLLPVGDGVYLQVAVVRVTPAVAAAGGRPPKPKRRGRRPVSEGAMAAIERFLRLRGGPVRQAAAKAAPELADLGPGEVGRTLAHMTDPAVGRLVRRRGHGGYWLPEWPFPPGPGLFDGRG